MITKEAFSTAWAIASKVDPAAEIGKQNTVIFLSLTENYDCVDRANTSF